MALCGSMSQNVLEPFMVLNITAVLPQLTIYKAFSTKLWGKSHVESETAFVCIPEEMIEAYEIYDATTQDLQEYLVALQTSSHRNQRYA